MADDADITPELCRQLLRYEPETGKLFMLPRPREMFESDRVFRIFQVRFEGCEALKSAHGRGYRAGHLLNKMYLAHRVIWAIQTGEWPDGQIDHINGDRSDNRWVNLRHVSNAENQRNAGLRGDNTSGALGVSWDKRMRRWHAYINIDGVRKQLGWYKSLDDAKAVRASAEEELGFHKNHGRRHAGLPRSS